MPGKQFELLGGTICLDFVNTIHEYGAHDPREELNTFEDLVAFAKQGGAITVRQAAQLLKRSASDPAKASRTLANARECRLALYRLFSAIAGGTHPPVREIDFLNRQLRQVLGNLRIQRRGDRMEWDWVNGDPNPERVLWPIIRSAADLLTSEERRLIQECGSKTCTWLFLDRSKNRTRLWCDMKTCGNRAKWRRYYEKHKKS